MTEIFKIINGFPDYQVSNKGRIKSFKRSSEGDIIKPVLGCRGYYLVNLMNNSKMSQLLIHRLVAIHFINNPDNLKVVNHKDLNKLNNEEDNLEWTTTRGNVTHYYESITTTSDFTGVYVQNNRFIVQIHANKERYTLGSYSNDKEASEIYNTALNIYSEKGLEALLEYKRTLYNKYSSKYMNVAYDRFRGKWLGSIYENGKHILRKRFETEDEAIDAVIEVYKSIDRDLHHTHTNYLNNKK